VTQFLLSCTKPAKITGMSLSDDKVTRLPITREKATEIVREISEDSRRWAVLVVYEEHQEWRQLVNRRQIELRLKEGYILEPRSTVNEHGHHVFSIARVCAGLDVAIKVAVDIQGASSRLYVLGINGDRIER
jgi:hypothetical protein